MSRCSRERVPGAVRRGGGTRHAAGGIGPARLCSSIGPRGRGARDEGSAFAVRITVHAGVSIGRANTEARERLILYCARPALSLERLDVLPNSLITYRSKYPLSGGRRHRVMQPMELMARLAALVPRKRRRRFLPPSHKPTSPTRSSSDAGEAADKQQRPQHPDAPRAARRSTTGWCRRDWSIGGADRADAGRAVLTRPA